MRMSATARANWPRRWATVRSVLRRSCPKFDNHELVRSTGQRMPRGTGLVPVAVPAGPATCAHEVVDAEPCDEAAGDAAVVAAVEVQGLHLAEQAPFRDGVEGRLQHDAVVAVGAVDALRGSASGC